MKLKLFLAATAVVLGTLAHADMLAMTFSGDVYDVDSNNGSKVLLKSTGLDGVNSMACNFSTYYVARDAKLYTVNAVNGNVTFVRQLTFAGAIDIRATAFDSRGGLWAVTQGTTADALWKVDFNTGEGTLVGSTGRQGIQAMDFNADDELYAWDVGQAGQGLVKLSRLDGHSTDVNPAEGSPTSIQSIAFRQDGTLMGADADLYLISTTTGKIRQQGTGLGDVRGIEFSNNNPSVIAPSSLQIALGKLSAGTVASLLDEDNESLVVCRFIVPNSTTPPVQVNLSAASPFEELDLYRVEIIHKMADAGAFQIEIQAFNYFDSRFDTLGTGSVTTNRTKTIAEATNPTNYVSASRQLLVKYRVKPVGPTAVLQWCHDADRMLWKISPFIR